ncbi:MAG: hypothetical protein EZS28_040443, partial [Streblomastix strix]
RFSKSETTNKKITQINFESSENVAESGGADQIIGDGNVYVLLSTQQTEQTDLLTKVLFTVQGKEFESTEGLNSAAIALGSGINYGLISSIRFSKSETTNKKITQINFESSENVAESGGADQIIGDGNVYVLLSTQQTEQTDLLTKGLFTVEGKEDEAFDSASKKITIIIEEQEQDPSKDEDVGDKPTQADIKKSKNNNVLIIIVIIAVSIVVVIIILIIVAIAHKQIMKKEQYKSERREERRREMDELNDDEVSM